MTRSGDSALGTCPATLSHLVGLFGIDVEDISRAATKKGGQIARVTPGKTGAPPVDHLLAMYDRLEWPSAIKLHFRGIRASLKHQSAARSAVCASLAPMGIRQGHQNAGAYTERDLVSYAHKIQSCLPFA